MVAGCQRLDFAGSSVDPLKISRSVFCNVDIDPTVVFTPDRPAWAASSRCALISPDAASDIEVVTYGQVLGRRAGLIVCYEQIGLSVRLHRLVPGCPPESDSFAVIAERVISHAAVKAQHFSFVTAIECNRVQIRMRRFVIWFGNATSNKVYARAIRRKRQVAFIEGTPGDLFGLRLFRRRSGNADGPNVGVDLWIEITSAVGTVNGFRYDSHIAHMLG